MPQKLTRGLAAELLELASEKRPTSTGSVREDFIDLGLATKQGNQSGVRLEDDEWYSTKKLGKRLQTKTLSGKRYKVATLRSPEDGEFHVYLVPVAD